MLPWAIGIVEADAIADDNECFLALEVHEHVAQFLRIEIDVISEPLTDKQPDSIRREDERTVVGIGLVHTVEEGMRQLHQRL